MRRGIPSAFGLTSSSKLIATPYFGSVGTQASGWSERPKNTPLLESRWEMFLDTIPSSSGGHGVIEEERAKHHIRVANHFGRHGRKEIPRIWVKCEKLDTERVAQFFSPGDLRLLVGNIHAGDFCHACFLRKTRSIPACSVQDNCRTALSVLFQEFDNSGVINIFLGGCLLDQPILGCYWVIFAFINSLIMRFA